MTDKMEKQAMEKFFNYMKAYGYPPRGYSGMNSYYPSSMHADANPFKETQKDKKAANNHYPSNQMYGYPFNPYSMPYAPPGFSMEAEGEGHRMETESKHKPQASHPYSSYYPSYPYYPYNMYPPSYYYNQKQGFPDKKQPEPKIQQEKQQPQLKILPKEKPAIKKEIVISSDSQDAMIIQKPPVSQPINPPPSNASFPITKSLVFQRQLKMLIPEKKANIQVIIEEEATDPFYIRKKQKIYKQAQKAQKLKFPKADKEKKDHQNLIRQDKYLRYNTMPAETYQQMMRKQSRMGLEMFYERQKQKEQQLKERQEKLKEVKDKQIQKEAPKLIEKVIEIEKKQMIDEKQERQQLKKDEKDVKESNKKEEKEKELPKKDQKRYPNINMMTALCTGQEQKEGKRQRIRDDHPLKELRYNQSHGRIRLGIYFQSNIPNLMRNEEISMRRLELQRKLREREVSAVTF